MECFILAGGKSKRFGADKLLYEINGKKVIERVVKEAKKVCKKVYIVAKNEKKFSSLNLPVIKDKFEESASVVGLYTALKNCKDKCLILSGDVPLIKAEILRLLIENYEPPITLIKTEKVHTLIGVYSNEVLEELEKYIENKNFKIFEFVKKVGFKEVEIPREMWYTALNLNTKEDLKKLIAIENHS